MAAFLVAALLGVCGYKVGDGLCPRQVEEFKERLGHVQCINTEVLVAQEDHSTWKFFLKVSGSLKKIIFSTEMRAFDKWIGKDYVEKLDHKRTKSAPLLARIGTSVQTYRHI